MNLEQLETLEVFRIAFTIEGDPTTKARARAVPGADQGRALALSYLDSAIHHGARLSHVLDNVRAAARALRGSHGSARMVKPTKTKAYEKRVTGAFDATLLEFHTSTYHDWRPHRGPVILNFAATFPIPSSWPKWQQAAARYGLWQMTSPPDTDNLEKAIADGLTGSAFHVDSLVIGGTHEKRYGECPGVFVGLIFLNQPTFREWKALVAEAKAKEGPGPMGPPPGG